MFGLPREWVILIVLAAIVFVIFIIIGLITGGGIFGGIKGIPIIWGWISGWIKKKEVPITTPPPETNMQPQPPQPVPEPTPQVSTFRIPGNGFPRPLTSARRMN